MENVKGVAVTTSEGVIFAPPSSIAYFMNDGEHFRVIYIGH